MQKNKPQFIFVNPNTPEETIAAIKKMIVEHIIQQSEVEKLNLSEKTA